MLLNSLFSNLLECLYLLVKRPIRYPPERHPLGSLLYMSYNFIYWGFRGLLFGSINYPHPLGELYELRHLVPYLYYLTQVGCSYPAVPCHKCFMPSEHYFLRRISALLSGNLLTLTIHTFLICSRIYSVNKFRLLYDPVSERWMVLEIKEEFNYLLRSLR